jgi:inosine-uridine nucleoside N-ribohydrolase
MTATEYLVISVVTYNVPVYPGAHQPVHQANATATQITEANRQYKALLIHSQQQVLALHVSVINALRQQVLVKVDNKYLLALEHPIPPTHVGIPQDNIGRRHPERD